jgi:hypothetical protein
LCGKREQCGEESVTSPAEFEKPVSKVVKDKTEEMQPSPVKESFLEKVTLTP